MPIITLLNQKGGVGKTTTAVNLSAALAQGGLRVLLVDSDPQGNATSGVGIEKGALERCLYDCMVAGLPADAVRLRTTTPRLDALPATIKLADAEIEMVALLSRETRLRQTLQPLRDNYDVILIDCPPSMGLLTINTLVAADAAIIPMQCEYFALEGISSLVKVVDLVRQQLNPPLKVSGVLLTMYDPRMRLTEQVMEEVKSFFGEKLFKTVIPRNVRLSEAPSHGVPVIEYDPRCRGAEAYLQFAAEFVHRESIVAPEISTRTTAPLANLTGTDEA
jgi:chromosome partitioning protein